ncbi:MAG: diaminopimelate epimerase [Desulfovibrio sp.]|jgi:diaminopimelate epimerase|nr:diaminopimelate epimerase [Desulfovibrio sp.]
MNETSAFLSRPAPVTDKTLPRLLPFTKMQGLGNDYVYVEEFGAPLADPAPLAVAISDRHFGVGGDGLVLIGPSEKADFRMRIFNADGSEAEMCGNAVRCIGKYLYEKGLTAKTEITLETLAGIRVLALRAKGARVETVRVHMGRPALAPADIPMEAEGESFVNRDILVDGISFRGTAVSMGNPHLVIPVPRVADFALERFGPLCEHHPWFPKRVNTEFVEVLDRARIRMRVWERGSGETLACGTGACAALVACSLNGWTDRKAVLELRGGELEIEWAGDDAVYMTGGAAIVFSGEYLIGA